ncbi:MAG: DUF5615 family PIN-like protein [Candidatus Kuenenia stuttgartiensis]|uniref:DUF5615 family PIN-like protein n=2 Tax=Candidatus Kuenenia TaxID=380738 RepID=UPI001C6B952B|nr:DUF5615 family PIN-like protein [Candidatus Kuenenia stuttgartiensis]
MPFRLYLPMDSAMQGMILSIVREYGLSFADDVTILRRATKENRILVSADTDYRIHIRQLPITENENK